MATQDISQLVVEVKSTGIQTAANQLGKLATSADKAEAAVKKLGTAVVGVNGVMTGGVAQAAALVSAMTALTAILERMAVSQTRAATGFRLNNDAMREAHALARGLSGSLGALWVTYGNLAGMAAGIALGASLKGIVEVGKDVEQTLEEIRIQGQTTTEDMTKMAAAVADLGKGINGPREVAEALKTLTLAGLNAKEAMTGVGAALNLSVGGGVSIEKSAETLVQVGSALGYTADGFDHVADVIMKAAAVSMSSTESISGAFKSAAAVGTVYGASLQDIALGLAAVANLGIQGTAAGTALKNLYKDLSASTDKVTKTLGDMKLSIASFRGSDGFMLPLVDVIKKLDAGLSTLSPKARSMAMVKLFGQQGVREGAELVKLLHTASDQVDELGHKYESKLDEMYGALNKAAAFSTLAAIAMAQTTTNQLKSVGNTLQTTFVEVFQSVAPQIGDIARDLKSAFGSPEFKSALTSVATGIANVTKFVVENKMAVLELAAAWWGGLKLVALIPAMNAAAAAIYQTVVAAGGLFTMMRTVATGFTLAGAAAAGFNALLGPIGITIAALTAAWVLYKSKQSDALTTDFLSASSNLQEYTDGVIKAAQHEQEILKMRKEGKSQAEIDRQRQMQEDQDASDRAVQNSKNRVLALKEEMDAQAKNLSTTDKAVLAIAKARGDKDAATKGAQKYLDAENAYNKALEVHTNNVKLAQGATQRLIELRQQNAKLADEAAKKGMVLPTGDGELSAKGVSDADKYAKSIAVFAGQIKSAHQELSQFREQEDAAFKAGQIGKLTLIDEIANKEVDTAKVSAAAFKSQMDIAAAHLDKNGNHDRTADAERFKDQMERANDQVDQAERMRIANRATAEREAQAELTNMRVKALEEEGKFSEAAALKWGSDGKIILDQVAAEAERSGGVWLKLMWQIMDMQKAATDSATVKEDSMAFKAAILDVEGTLKGFKAATFGTSIDTMFASAETATEKFAAAMEVAKAKRDKLLADNQNINTPESQKALAEANKEILAQADHMKTVWQEVGQTITDSLTKAFGTAGTAMGELYKASIEYAQSENATVSDRLKQYGDMTQAASGFFDKQSKGYRVLSGLAQIFHVAEMARTVVRTVAYIAAGAANMFAQGGFLGFAGVAAMGAVMAGLGYGMAGAHGADPTANADYVQKHQGTGNVFGNVDAQSESIKKSLDSLKSNSDMMLPLTQSMVNSLQNIETSLTGLANLAVRQGVGNGSNFNIQEGTTSKGFIGGAVGNVLNSNIGWLVSPVLKIVNALWGKTTQTLVDSGLMFGGKVSALQSGQGYNQYATTETSKSSFFGLVKSSSTSMQTQGVSEELSRQFGLVFSNLEDTLKGAATTLGQSSDAVGSAIENLVLDTTKVSLKGLSGDDLTKAINGVISDAMDQIAKAAYPHMEAFQQVGEGYAQTVIRVASGIEQADAALKKLHVQAIGYLDIANKTGDVAYEIAKQSIALKEGSSGVGQIMAQISGSMSDVVSAYTDLVNARKQMQKMGLGNGLNFNTLSGAGDLKSLTSDLTTYYDKYFSAQERAAMETKDLTEQFNAFGFDLPNTREQLRGWIETAASVGDQLKVGQLLSLASAFDALATSLDKVDPFSDDAVKKAKQAYDDAVNAAEKAYSKLEKAVNAEKKPIQDAMDALKTVMDDVQSNMESLAEAMQKTIKPTLTFEQSMKTVRSAISMLHGGGDITKMAGLSNAVKNVASVTDEGYSTLLDFQRAQAEAYNALDELSTAGKSTLDIEQAQLDALDNVLETARAQLDALEGIDNSVGSVAAALAAFGSAMQTATVAKANYEAVSAGNTGGGISAALDSLYKNVLGRSADAAGKAWWTNQVMNKGVSMDAVTQAFYNSDEFKHNVPSFDVGTNDVPHDMLAMVHKGERIIPAADNAELQRKLDTTQTNETSNASIDDLKAQLAELSDSVKRGDIASVQKFNDLYKLMLRWETNGMPAVRDTTTS